MRISFCCADTPAQPWLDGLRAALPGAVVEEWAAGDSAADYAVVWAPPQVFFDQQTQLKAIFNTGAGVDALLKLRLPPGVPVVRLDDAGMAVQMAEYVCHAVIRHFREFDVYDADTAQGRWAQRPPRLRQDFPVGVMGLGALGERVSRALAAFDFPVRGWSRSPKQVPSPTCERRLISIPSRRARRCTMESPSPSPPSCSRAVLATWKNSAKTCC